MNNELTSRLDRLEIRNRRLTVAVILMGAMLLALVTVGATSKQGEPSDTLQASALEIVDDNGCVRARLNVDDENQAGLALFDSRGVQRQRFYIVNDSIPRLSFYDRDGNIRELLGVSSDGCAVKLFDENGVMRTLLGLYIDGTTGLILMDDTGLIRAGFGLDVDGEASVEFFDETGGPSGGVDGEEQ